MTDKILLKLTSISTIAHGEAGPNASGPNNTTLFNRQQIRLPRETAGASEDQARTAIEQLLNAFDLGDVSLELLAAISGSELIAVLFVAQVPLIYGGGDGEGLFSGIDRYQYLTTRLADGAICNSTLSGLWSYLSRKLMLPMFAEKHFDRMRALFTLPPSIQAQVINAIIKKVELCVMGARLVVDGMKGTSVGYAMARNQDLFETVKYKASATQIADLVSPKQEAVIARIPALSGNAVRHCMLRAPGATRLLQACGLVPETKRVPIGVERFLYGGGNTAAKAKTPGNAALLEAKIRAVYPIVDALGGTVDQFLLSRSAVSINSWIVCQENNTATRAVADIESGVSIYDMITETTRTRMGVGGKDKESGQMIFSYETLTAGLQIIVEILFQPFTRDITKGAIVQAILDWQSQGGILGARAATGHGQFNCEPIGELPLALAAEYQNYLEANKEQLAAGLLDGGFGTGVVLCAA